MSDIEIRRDDFFKAYAEQLALAVTAKPEDYGYGIEAVPAVAEKMRRAWERGTASKEGRAMRATCRKFGIPDSYRAIREYLGLEAGGGK